MFTWSRDWTTLFPLRKTVSALHFQLRRFWKQYFLSCTRFSACKQKRCEFLLMRKLKDTLFVLQKSTNSQSRQFDVQETCMELCGTADVWFTVSFPLFFLRMLGWNTLPKEQKNARFLPIQWIRRWKPG